MLKKSPFKFLDSFTKDDREIFFGRDKEIEELHSRTFESKILLVYGTSGTGKSSLINCGLANKFSESDWLPVSIRRGIDINTSLFDALSKNALTRAPFEKAAAAEGGRYNLEKLLRSVYLDHFKPLFLIFDQFEELFIFGNQDEKNILIQNVSNILDSDIQCRFIFSIREEYLAGVTEFERVIPTFFSNRIRIEKMTRQNAVQTIEGPCRISNIKVDEGFSEALLEKLNPDSPEVELTWLQIFLDKVLRLAGEEDNTEIRFSTDMLERLGDVKDILGTFLEEQISQLNDQETGLIILKSFVSVKGTKRQITEEELIEYSRNFGKDIDNDVIKELIQKFIRLRILRDKDEAGNYELRHDSLASKIFEKITLVEKELLEIKFFIENAYSNFEKRSLLLSAEDLKYIAPYEDKLFLNEKSLKFISQSKQAFLKAKRRRQNILIATASLIIIILSFFTVWAMKEKGNAVAQQQIAENQKNAAVLAKVEADSAKQEAVLSRQKAENNEKEAIDARNQSEVARREAFSARESALRQKTLAEQMSLIANEQARKAEEEKKVAETQRIIAQLAEEKAKRLSLLSKAQNLALKSMTMEYDPLLMGLIAVQAFNFNKENGGPDDDPVIYKALNHAYATIDFSKHSIYNGSLNEIWSLATNGSGIMSADMDGKVINWGNNGIINSVPNTPLPSYINLVSLNPSGDKLVTGYENGKLTLKNLDQNSIETELKGLAGPVTKLTWSNNGNFLASAGKDSVITIWNIGINSLNPAKILKSPSGIKSMVFCSNDTIISIQEDNTIILWNIQNSTSELLLTSEYGEPVCVAWNKPNKILMAGCSNGALLLFNMSQKPFKASVDQISAAGISNIIFSNDYSLMAISSWDKTMKLYNYQKYLEQPDRIGGVINIDDIDLRARSLIFSDDNRLVAGMSDKSIRIWETSSMKIASIICGLVKRDMTEAEWTLNVGEEIPYEKTCGNKP